MCGDWDAMDEDDDPALVDIFYVVYDVLLDVS